ncbi:hypothetical protein BWD09_04540 [Neisseria dentiae]|uniref:Uncharacterized protein n=1 Tax=Neisseria dentiae TaxID=194197 RepID=A0A1X3DDF7_9NEIS|nr:hypothetical protein BWD09_04540 [Neisseria dentiae]
MFQTASGRVVIMLAKRFFEEKSADARQKAQKIEHLSSISNAADADFNQKYRRNAVDYMP